ncbi:MAG: thioredoxin domain-containing protein [Chitinophagaceae bacterium]
MKYTNKLIHETSPYLLQHAHNPVDWHPWGEEALQKAKQEEKPILVSIGYAACHWCHVMEKESFEDERTAVIMNQHFVCIKIDREERPDLDHLFMDALQAIAGNGGWPLNMFLTSEGKPFYGGTYFPPKRVYNRHSWQEVLIQIQQAYQTRRPEIEDQANNLVEYLTKSNQTVGFKADVVIGVAIDKEQCDKVFQAIMTMSDKEFGGFGKAPKFPQTFTIQYLLRYAHFTGNKEALQQAELSLKSMMRGGIYDQIGGGFCRYSTDATWLAPHFEKMTYDNALLLVVLSEAYQLTKEPEYKQAAIQTVDFMKREMMSEQAGFYAALDADSEGEEGKFYTWTQKEFVEVLQEDATIMAEWFDVTEEGNWEGVNILRTKKSLDAWRSEHKLSEEEALNKIKQSVNLLLSARNKRIRPGTDDKVILGWNALFNHALVKAAIAFEVPEWLEVAEVNMQVLLNIFQTNGEIAWLHTFKNDKAKYPAFLDDLAYLVQALLALYEPTGKLSYLENARSIISYLHANYADEEEVFFYFTHAHQKDILVRKKDIYDGAMPSGNAIMAWNLYKAAILLGEEKWKQQSLQMLERLNDGVLKYPNSFGIWANLMLEVAQGTHEILVLGPKAKQEGKALLNAYLPNKVVMLSNEINEQYPLMLHKSLEERTTFYVCRDYTCQLPLFSSEETLLKVLTK